MAKPPKGQSSPIGLISAVAFEADRLGLRRAGRVHGKPVVYMASGVGIANAPNAATVLIERFSPRLIILFGIGGAYPHSGFGVGDVVAAKKEIYADAGLILKDGFHGMKETGLPLLRKGRRKFFNEFPLDRTLLKKALSIGLPSGVFLTVSASTGTLKRALELERRYGADCENMIENMEGAAAAHICALYGTPLIEIRGISNIVEDRDIKKWDKETASLNCQKAVLELIKRL